MKEIVKVRCHRCTEEFERNRRELKDEAFCSKSCARKFYWESKTGAYQAEFKCDWCGKPFKRGINRSKGKNIFCSTKCAAVYRNRDSMHSKIRKCIEENSSSNLLDLIKSNTTKTLKECWIGFVDDKPYPSYSDHNGKRKSLYRLVLSMTSGISMPEMQVHHICADGRCLNPDHLQYASRVSNMAEMLERTAYLKRISKLENAIKDIDPDNPLLKVWNFNEEVSLEDD